MYGYRMKDVYKRQVLGHAEIRQIFKASGVGNIAGSYVLDGMFQSCLLYTSTPILERMNFELVDVEYVKEGGTWYLRAYIDKEGGITVNAVSYTHLPCADDSNGRCNDTHQRDIQKYREHHF